MKTDSKIAYIIIITYLITGLYSYSYNGIFITPFFLNYPILVGFSLYAWFIYRKHQDQIILGAYTFGLLAISFTHSLTVSAIGQLFKINSLIDLEIPEYLKVISIIIFYLTLFFIQFKIYKRNNSLKITLINTAIILLSFIFVFLNFTYLQVISLSTFMLLSILTYNYNQKNTSEIQGNLSHQFLLFLIIENIRFIIT